MAVTFKDVYRMLDLRGPGRVTSSRGTEYRIEARNGNIIAFPRSGRVTIHHDCWLQSTTCQGTWAGGVYKGPYSILDWYREATQ